MARMIFVNLPVKDLKKSVAFYTGLGFTINPQFTDENAACVVISDTIYLMLLVEKFFVSFTKKAIANTALTNEAIQALSAENRAEVDDLAERALKNGGTPGYETTDHGWMYSRSFQDPDGHLWEVMYMDPAGPPAS